MRRLLLALVAAALVAATLPVSALAAPATTISRGPTDRPRIALTFDDNFRTDRGRAILDVLARYDCPATMFVVGAYIHTYPDLARRIATGGFEVGDHTLNHPDLRGQSWSRLAQEIGGGTDAYRRLTGARTSPLFRPPYGSTDARVAEVAGQNGFRYQVMWDIDTNDWRGYSASTIRNHVLSRARNGSIVLFHLSAAHTAEALPGIITGLRSRGYELVTVSGLLKGGRRFIDVDPASMTGEAILGLVNQGIMSGYDADWFGPADPLTRAQLAKVAVLSGGLHTAAVDNASSPTFPDVLPQKDASGALLAYPFDFVEEAAAAGLVAGRDRDGRRIFDPYGRVTRLQLAQVVARMARNLKGYPEVLPADLAGLPPAGPGFADVPEYGAADTALTARLGLMRGFDETRFDPFAPAQRAHVALVMARFLDLAAYVAPPDPTTTTTLPPTTTTTLPPGANTEVSTAGTAGPTNINEAPTSTTEAPTAAHAVIPATTDLLGHTATDTVATTTRPAD
jgi:peptidoglycan/xylan/chitin deacetylase (PgdA/CDA1 family)